MPQNHAALPTRYSAMTSLDWPENRGCTELTTGLHSTSDADFLQ